MPPTDEQLNAADAEAARLAAHLKGRPAATADGVEVGTFNGGWEVMDDATIRLEIDVPPHFSFVYLPPDGGEPYFPGKAGGPPVPARRPSA